MVYRISKKRSNQKGSSDAPRGDASSAVESLLTPAQREVLDFIRSTCERNGVPPSYREIAAHFGYKAIGTVQDHIKALHKKGWLEPVDKGKRARGLVPVGYRMEGVRRIPIYGEIAAGSLRDSPQVEMGGLVVTDTMAREPCFALRVVGDSMVDAGIFEGDHLIVERQAPVKSGDIVVALWNGETTVKRYLVKAGEVWLHPENARMKPFRVSGGNFQIQGKVVGLQRRI